MELKKRSEFPENELWDLTALYQDQEDFLRAIEKTREEINEFVRNYKGKLHTFEDFEAAFTVFEQIQIQLSHIGNYSFMPQTTDFGDEAFAEIAQAGMDFETWASVELSFFDDALVEGLEQNQDFFSLLLDNDEIKRQVLGIFAADVYNELKSKKNVIYPKLKRKTVELNVAEEVDTYGSNRG